jgi:hypothetical protein
MFLTIRAQIKANKIIQDQIISDNDSKKINVLFDFLQKSLDTLGIRELENSGMPLTNNVVSSIAYIFSEAGKNQGENTRLKIKAIKIQLLDALTLIDRLFELLKVSKDNNKDIMLFILKHIFNSKFKLLASESNVGLFGEELITISNRLNSTLGSL